MIRALEREGFTVVPVRMRHCYTMLGGLHCSTLDVVRRST
jgi:N-dimethylarginine dimethylaminohydrolase